MCLCLCRPPVLKDSFSKGWTHARSYGECACVWGGRDRHLGNEMEIIAVWQMMSYFSEGKFFIGQNFVVIRSSETSHEGNGLSFKALWSFTESVCGLSFTFTVVRSTAYWGLPLEESSMFVSYGMQLSSKIQMPWKTGRVSKAKTWTGKIEIC